jgi:hypothetical protein
MVTDGTNDALRGQAGRTPSTTRDVVQQLPARRTIKHLVWIGAAVPWAVACLAADPYIQVPHAQATQLSVYVSKPVGTPGAHWVSGLRIDRTTVAPLLAGATGPLRRHPLVDLQFARRAPTRVELGGRMLWDPRSRQIELPALLPAAILHESVPDLPMVATGHPSR